MIKEINENIYYIGVLDKNLQVFDVIMETKYGTSYNSYLVKTKNHNILIETVKVPFFDEYLANINELVGVQNIDTIIVNHTEPDHAGSIEKILELNPDITVIGSKAAISYLMNITNKTFKNRVVKPNEEICFDDMTFQFFSVPNLHWPDSIYTYIKEEEILFTCDSFGSHYAIDDIFLSKMKKDIYNDYMDSFKYYYDAIFAPYKKFVLQALDKIKDLSIKTICTGHGPILDENSSFYFNTYKEWSTYDNPFGKLVVVPYASSYGYTGMMAEAITKGIKSFDNDIDVRLYNLNVNNYQEFEQKIVKEIYYADAVLFGSTTINKDATPVISDLVTNINPVIHHGKYVATFGSYGWSGEGIENIQNRLKNAGFKVLPSFKLKFKPSIENEKRLENYGKELAEAIYTKTQDFTYVNDSKVTIS